MEEIFSDWLLIERKSGIVHPLLKYFHIMFKEIDAIIYSFVEVGSIRQHSVAEIFISK